MAKDKGQKGPAQKHLYSRISYLYQAATYLTKVATKIGTNHEKVPDLDDADHAIGSTLVTPDSAPKEPNYDGAALARELLSQARGISLKSVIRLTPAVKNAMCKRCDLLLVPGSTSSTHIENKSRHGKKPWADVLVVTCMGCGAGKRYPVGAKRKSKRRERSKGFTEEAAPG